MDYNILWFVLITVLFTGLFSSSRDLTTVSAHFSRFSQTREEDRSQVIRSIGPVWDGNEVWMITAGRRDFSPAFPACLCHDVQHVLSRALPHAGRAHPAAVAFEFRHQRTDEK